MKYYSRLKMYKATRGNVTFNPATKEAYSYNWWIFVKKIKGAIVFNSYCYSNQTAKHQSKVRSLLRDLGILIDLDIEVSGGLQEFETQALAEIYHEIYTLEALIKRPLTSTIKNKDRQLEISCLLAKADMCKKLGAKITQKQLKEIKTEIAQAEAAHAKAIAERRKTRPIKRLVDQISPNGNTMGVFS